MVSDLISRQQALKEMWKALHEYEDKTEKQFQESKYLDVRDWIINDRLWVQSGHNLCVNVLANLPSAQPERKKGKWIILPPIFEEICQCSKCKMKFKDALQWTKYCPHCGADMRGESDDND